MMAAKTKAKTKIGPHDHGRTISLKAFEFAKVEEGYRFELARGYIVVSEIPDYDHAMRLAFIRSQLGYLHVRNPDSLHVALDAWSCKLVIPDWESERHPDIAVYLQLPAGPKDRTMWRTWIPELVIEVVADDSRDRDYTQKRDEYWTLGVKEYWIVDAKLKRVLILKRGRTQWTETTLGPDGVCETKLLPGFKLNCQAIFDATGEQ